LNRVVRFSGLSLVSEVLLDAESSRAEADEWKSLTSFEE
jgi:hypothetical protein